MKVAGRAALVLFAARILAGGFCTMNTAHAAPQSVSEVVRDQTILLIRVDQVSPGEWAAIGGSLASRNVAMKITIEEVLKGQIAHPAGAPFGFTVTQRGTGTSRVMDYYGLWSHVKLAPGVRFVAFSKSASPDVREVLLEPQCEQLADPADALEVTRQALRLHRAGATPREVLEAAVKQAAERKDVFARYVWDRVRQEALSSPAVFDSLTRLITAADTNPEARRVYLDLVYDALGLIDPPRRDLELRLIRACFELLASPQGAKLRETLASLYIPNLIDLDNQPAHSAAEVFKDRSDLRSRAKSALDAGGFNEPPIKLRHWIDICNRQCQLRRFYPRASASVHAHLFTPPPCGAPIC